MTENQAPAHDWAAQEIELEPDNYVLDALKTFAEYGDREAIVQGGVRLTYKEVSNLIRSLASTLHEAGIEDGMGVAVLVRDSPESASLQMALHLLGCRTVWIVAYAPRRDQIAFLELSKPDVLIYSPAAVTRRELAEEMIARLPDIKVLTMGEADGGYQDLLADIKSDAPDLPLEFVGEQPSSLFYTGGTTGVPKLVHHWQGYYRSLQFIAAYYLSIDEPPMRFLSGSTYSYVSGQTPAFLTLFEGGTFFTSAGWDVADWLDTIKKETITSAFLTPQLLYAVLKHEALATADTSTLRYLNVGGAAANPARLSEAIDKLGPVVRIVYGSSELPLITDLPFLDHDPEHPERLTSAGQPFADSEVQVRDEAGNEVPAGESGEVWVKGSLSMAGYWQQPELTRETIKAGWVRTGDVGYKDADGFLFLIDRLSDMIVTSGAAANVYAKPIEDVLTSHPAVRSAAVFGIKGVEEEELVHAVVVTEPGAQVSVEELQDLTRTQLNSIYTPKTIEFAAGLPLTGQGKVDKKELRARHLAARSAG
ncbi:MAG TPA: AMP-binding protein [Streptosporangiaceae bacterium]|jgi:acyl-CoA synthetase (AMP-forming)/AMP-acid ligase II|nr:AMP-binding protein [Streptosporangiaceae bacterium]